MEKAGADMGFHIMIDKELSVILDEAIYAEVKEGYVEFRNTSLLLAAYRLDAIIGFHETGA